MKNIKKSVVLVSSISLCLGLTACSTTGSGSKTTVPSIHHTYNVKCTYSNVNYCVDAVCTQTIAAENTSVDCIPSMPTKVTDAIKNNTPMPVDVTVVAPSGNTTSFKITQEN